MKVIGRKPAVAEFSSHQIPPAEPIVWHNASARITETTFCGDRRASFREMKIKCRGDCREPPEGR